MITKFTQKKYSHRSKVYFSEENKFENVPYVFSDSNKYLSVIKNNIIDGDIRDLSISINVLNNIFDGSQKSRFFWIL